MLETSKFMNKKKNELFESESCEKKTEISLISERLNSLNSNQKKKTPNFSIKRNINLAFVNNNKILNNYNFDNLHLDKENLQIVELNYNELRSFPINIENYQNLKVLKLNENYLKVIPDSIFFYLKNIEVFSISDNLIQKIPENIVNWNNLSYLDFSKNLIELIPDYLGELSQLKYLNLENNNFTSFSTNLSKLRNLMQIEIDWFKYCTPSISPKNNYSFYSSQLLQLCENLKNKKNEQCFFKDFIEFFSEMEVNYNKRVQGKTYLHKAAEEGHIGVLRSYISLKIELINQLDDDLQSPLSLSICEQKYFSAKTLINFGADPNIGILFKKIKFCTLIK